MYKVKVLFNKELVDFEADARYCLVDANNNLVFQDKFISVGEPIKMFSTRAWVSVEKVDE